MAYREDARPDASPLEEIVEPYLGPDEEIRWVARARRGLALRAADAFLIPFSLVWGGFALLWELGVIAAGAPWFFACFGLPFVAVGLYLIAGRFLWDMHKRKHSIYAVTDDRLLILERGKLKAFALDKLDELTLDERADGSGRITIGKVPFGFQASGSKATVLEIAEDVRRVYRTILDAQADLKRGVRARVEIEQQQPRKQEQEHEDFVEEELEPLSAEGDR